MKPTRASTLISVVVVAAVAGFALDAVLASRQAPTLLLSTPLGITLALIGVAVVAMARVAPEPEQRVPADLVQPRPERRVPAEPREVLPQLLARDREGLGGHVVVAPHRLQIPEELGPVGRHGERRPGWRARRSQH